MRMTVKAVLALGLLYLCQGKRWKLEEQPGSSTGNGASGLLEIPTGRCLQTSWQDKLVVAARYEEDVSWMAAYLVPWMPFLVYSISGDQAATHQTLSNTGREAQAYLQFIVDYYDCLPQEVAFIHAHRSSQHSPDMLTELKRLRWGSIPGFVSLSNPPRFSTFFFDDPAKHKPAANDRSETAQWMQFAYEQNMVIQEAWPKLFEAELGPIPAELTSPCCGQFAISKEQIQAHPRSFYQGCLGWLQATPVDKFWAGLIFEHTWAYIFGAGTVYTPPEECSAFSCDRDGSKLELPWEAHLTVRSDYSNGRKHQT